MARPIKEIERNVPGPEEKQAQAINDLLKSTVENQEALHLFLDILGELHKAGVLEMIHGFLKQRHDIGEMAMEQMNEPRMHRTIKNGIHATQFISRLDPDQLEKVLSGLHQGLDKSSASFKNQKQSSLWEMLTSVRDPHINASMTMMLQFLQGMGEGMNKDQAPPH